jgi:hypothetical protein
MREKSITKKAQENRATITRKDVQSNPSKNLITPEQAARIVDGWVLSFFYDDEAIGDLLLILYALAYSRDMTKREEIIISIERVLMPFAPTVCDGLRQLLEERRVAAEKGGA